jgi:hypothetical protein
MSVTGGMAYDHLDYPQNFRTPPINGNQQTLDKISPKIGTLIRPLPGLTLRAAYMQANSGASFDESVQLEATEVDGFTQAYRTLASEDLLGSIAGSQYDLLGVSLEQKLSSRTYLGFEFNDLEQRVNRTLGVFDSLDSQGNYPTEILPSSLNAHNRYREEVFTGTLNQLVGDNWSFGVRYSYTISDLSQQIPELAAAIPLAFPGNVNALASNAANDSQSGLHQLVLTALYNDPSGFFSTLDAKWYRQDNEAIGIYAPKGDDFWQFDFLAGYRFYRNQCEVSCGVLNLTGQDYDLDPLNPYEELPRSQTIVVNAKFSF